MVLKARRRARTLPALVVPDERSWVMWGHHLAVAGFTAAASPEEAAAVLLPAQVPAALVPGLVEAVRRVPGTPRALMLASPLSGQPARDVLATAQQPAEADAESQEGSGEEGMQSHAPAADHGHGDQHGHDAGDDSDDGGESCGHGHGEASADSDEPWASNTMPIAGTPSRDGLVMDDVELVLGPLGPPLPGGLVAEMALDGEVVSRCELTAHLHVPPEERGAATPPDPLAPAAWQAACAQATAGAEGRGLTEAERRAHVAAVEVELALSHAVSARELGRALGWQELADIATGAVDSCMRARTALAGKGTAAGALDDAYDISHRVLKLLDDSRRLRSRTRGRGRLTASQLTGIAGPTARAAGVAVDALLGDPLYEALGFQMTTLPGGDAEARTVLRATEACDALRLAATAASERGGDGSAGAPVSGAVEGPRGPLRATVSGGTWQLSAPGAERLLQAAGQASVGESYSRAVVSLVSFDLSPWRVSA